MLVLDVVIRVRSTHTAHAHIFRQNCVNAEGMIIIFFLLYLMFVLCSEDRKSVRMVLQRKKGGMKRNCCANCLLIERDSFHLSFSIITLLLLFFIFHIWRAFIGLLSLKQRPSFANHTRTTCALPTTNFLFFILTSILFCVG